MSDESPRPAWMPERVKIGGLWFDVRVVPEPISRDEHGNDNRNGVRLWGCINHSQQQIEVADYAAPDRQLAILLHESIHGIEEDRGMSLKEREVNQLGLGIAAFLTDNGFVRVGDAES